jgi:hypothetical protein
MRTFQWLFVIVWLQQLPNVLNAQDKEVRLNAVISTREVVEGAHFEVTYQLSGSISGDLLAPNFSPFQRLGNTQELSGMQFVNGSVSAHHTWVFSLTAPASGEYTIPPAEVQLKGKVYRSKELRVRVLPATKVKSGGPLSIPAGADPSVFLLMEVNTASVYVGQQVVVKVYLYTKRALSGVNLVRLPELSSGNLKELERYNEAEEQVTVGGERYNRLLVYAGSFFAEAPGRVVVSPAVINTAVVSSNPFQSYRTIQLASSPLSLDVMKLPLPIPDGFSGLVGQYEVEAIINIDSILVGEAAVCTLSIQGNGNSRLLELPKVGVSEGLKGYEPIVKEEEVYENGRELAHRQLLEYTVSALSEGMQFIKPSLIWFDPDSNKYVRYEPIISIKVGPKQKGELFPTSVGGGEFWTVARKVGLGSIVVALAVLAGYFVVDRKNKMQITMPAPSSVPLEVSTVGLGQDLLVEEEKPTGFYAQVYWEVRRYFANRLGVAPEEVSKKLVSRWMEENGYSISAMSDMQFVFNTCEQALYAEQDHSADHVLIEGKVKLLLSGVDY